MFEQHSGSYPRDARVSAKRARIQCTALCGLSVLTVVVGTGELVGVQWYDSVGIGGVVLYILSYALLQLRQIDARGGAYSAMNLTAASMVLVSLYHEFNLASALIQVFWITFSIIGLLFRYFGLKASK